MLKKVMTMSICLISLGIGMSSLFAGFGTTGWCDQEYANCTYHAESTRNQCLRMAQTTVNMCDDNNPDRQAPAPYIDCDDWYQTLVANCHRSYGTSMEQCRNQLQSCFDGMLY